MAHEHTSSSDGFLAAHMMLITTLILVAVAAVVIIALVAWQPWEDGEGGINVDISGEGGGDTGGDAGGNEGESGGNTSWHYEGPTFVIERAA